MFVWHLYLGKILQDISEDHYKTNFDKDHNGGAIESRNEEKGRLGGALRSWTVTKDWKRLQREGRSQ